MPVQCTHYPVMTVNTTLSVNAGFLEESTDIFVNKPGPKFVVKITCLIIETRFKRRCVIKVTTV